MLTALTERHRELTTRLDTFDQRLHQLEQRCQPRPGELDLYGAYQLLVNELAAVKTAVIGLQRTSRDDAAPAIALTPDIRH